MITSQLLYLSSQSYLIFFIGLSSSIWLLDVKEFPHDSGHCLISILYLLPKESHFDYHVKANEFITLIFNPYRLRVISGITVFKLTFISNLNRSKIIKSFSFCVLLSNYFLYPHNHYLNLASTSFYPYYFKSLLIFLALALVYSILSSTLPSELLLYLVKKIHF